MAQASAGKYGPDGVGRVLTCKAMAGREERKRAAREARLETERREAAAAQRRRRMTRLSGVVLGAAAIVAILIAVSSGGGSKNGRKTTQPAASALLSGIPQKGLALGSAKAPVTIVEFNDMQCPICRDYQTTVFPDLVKRYVRTGKVRMEMRLQSFIGPDSVTAGKAVAAAALQNRAWTFADTFYANQQQENSGYVTPDFLKSIASATPGLNHSKLVTDASSPTAAQVLKDGQSAFDARNLTGTPSFLIGRTGGQLSVLNWSALTPSQFTGPINSLLAE
jgi:protein-disulfide isomerase